MKDILKDKEEKAAKIIKSLSSCDSIAAVNKEIKEVFKKMSNNPETKNAEKVLMATPLPSKKRAYWNHMVQMLSDYTCEDVKFELMKHAYDFARGVTKEGNSDMLKFLITNIVVPAHEIVPEEGFMEGTTAAWDTPQAIDDMAGRTLYLLTNQYITLSMAERMFELLEKKVKFLESSHLLKNLEKLDQTVNEKKNFNPYV